MNAFQFVFSVLLQETLLVLNGAHFHDEIVRVCYLFSSYYSQLNRFCLKQNCVWTVTVFKHAFTYSLSCLCSYHAVHQTLGSHYIIISISRTIRHSPSVFIVIHLTNILQSMDLRQGKAAQFGSDLQGSCCLTKHFQHEVQFK